MDNNTENIIRNINNNSFYTPHGLKIRLNQDFFNPGTFRFVAMCVENVFTFFSIIKALAFLYCALFGNNDIVTYIAAFSIAELISVILLLKKPGIINHIINVFAIFGTLLVYGSYIAGIILYIYNADWKYMLIAFLTRIVAAFLSFQVKDVIIRKIKKVPITDVEYYALACEKHANLLRYSIRSMHKSYSEKYLTK